MSIEDFTQIKMARGALGWSTQKLAEQSHVSSRTLNRLETAEGFAVATKANLSLVQRTFEQAGIEFIGTAEKGPGVRLWKQP
jgi:transcriptional regulator with XRE-family HTH domain